MTCVEAFVNKTLFAISACMALAIAGCGGSDSVEATPRTSSNAPVFGSATVAAPDVANQLDFGFIHEDHFACVTINVEKILANPDMADVPWDALEKQLANTIGASNSKLAELERVWVLVDRDGIPEDESDSEKSPFVFVVDFKKSVNETELTSAFASLAAKKKDDEEAKEPDSVAVKIGEKRIAIGSPSLVAKIKSTGTGAGLARQLKQMDLKSDVDGLMDIKPIRNLLKSTLEIMAQFGGETFQKLSRLPDSLQRLEMSLSLNTDELFQVVAHIDDEPLTKELAIMVNENLGSSSSLGGGMPFGLASLGGGPGNAPRVMINPTATDAMAVVGKEIADEGLFTVNADAKKLTLSLKRPSKFTELVQASLHDGIKQFELGERVGKMQKIGAALNEYVDAHGCFPPSGIVIDSKDGLPNQFNWRVGLLPFLDQQAMYEQFDFTKAWDSDENLKVAKNIPDVFSDSKQGNGGTDQSASSRFHVIGGKLGLYTGDRTPSVSDIEDKKTSTAVVIEGAKNTSVPWTKPGSLEIDAVNPDQFGEADENGVLICNGSFKVRIIGKERDRIAGVISPNGGETMRSADFLPLGPMN